MGELVVLEGFMVGLLLVAGVDRVARAWWPARVAALEAWLWR